MSEPLIRYYHPDIIHETYYSESQTARKNVKTVITVYDMIHEKFSGVSSISNKTPKKKKYSLEIMLKQ